MMPKIAPATILAFALALHPYAEAAPASTAAHPVAPCTPREKIAAMFVKMKSETPLDFSHALLWGYYFTAPSAEALPPLADALRKAGYRMAEGIRPNDDGDRYWLHVEKIETHTINSLDVRDRQLCALASRFPSTSYDGVDVGPVDKKATKQ